MMPIAAVRRGERELHSLSEFRRASGAFERLLVEHVASLSQPV